MTTTQEIRNRFSTVERNHIVDKCHQCLWTREGTKGLEYLTQSRSISEDVIKRFRLGYMPSELGHQLSGRIIFPLFDASGNLVSLSSRLLPDARSVLPVYWHEAYEKSFYLYGTNIAKEPIRENGYCILSEGQFDILQMHNHGFTNTVGLFGTAMRLPQIATVLRYCSTLVLLLDSDENKAGQSGAEKILELGMVQWRPCVDAKEGERTNVRHDLNVVPVWLPIGKDPDEFLREGKSAELRSMVKSAIQESKETSVF